MFKPLRMIASEDCAYNVKLWEKKWYKHSSLVALEVQEYLMTNAWTDKKLDILVVQQAFRMFCWDEISKKQSRVLEWLLSSEHSELVGTNIIYPRLLSIGIGWYTDWVFERCMIPALEIANWNSVLFMSEYFHNTYTMHDMYVTRMMSLLHSLDEFFSETFSEDLLKRIIQNGVSVMRADDYFVRWINYNLFINKKIEE